VEGKVKNILKSVYNRRRQKFFCIGLNKTGTTTIENVFKEFGYSLGSQKDGELLIFDWFNRDFNQIIKHCKTAEVFQDIPFSLSYTYIILEQHFENAKFILTVRDNAEQWYDSLINFHAKIWGNGENPPTVEQLKKGYSLYPGFAYETLVRAYNTEKEDIYNKEKLIFHYESHINYVKEYFKNKPDKLLVINVSKKEDYKRLCTFLKKPYLRDDFPWMNKTK
jgi:hypothetical protein